MKSSLGGVGRNDKVVKEGQGRNDKVVEEGQGGRIK